VSGPIRINGKEIIIMPAQDSKPSIEQLARAACKASGHDPDQPMDPECTPPDMADLAEDVAWKEFVPAVEAVLSMISEHRLTWDQAQEMFEAWVRRPDNNFGGPTAKCREEFLRTMDSDGDMYDDRAAQDGLSAFSAGVLMGRKSLA
jgi:hypothetical protein